MAGTTPLTSALQPSYVSAPPQDTASLVDPSSQIAQILAAYQPAAQQSQMNLNGALAASGVSGGGMTGATQQLQGQLAAGLAPSLASAIGNANSENQSAINSANQFNTSNLINANTGNVSTANNFQQYLAGLNNQDWLAQLQGYTGLNESGLSGQQGINQEAAGNYGIQGGTTQGLGSLTSALGNMYGTASPASTPQTTSTPYDGSYLSDGNPYVGVY
jgi:hypothetical protein